MESLHEYVIRSLRAKTETYAQIAEGAGLSQRTVEKIARGEIVDPGVSMVEKLATYFRKQRSQKTN